MILTEKKWSQMLLDPERNSDNYTPGISGAIEYEELVYPFYGIFKVRD